jgi:hypothetical protein
MNQNPTNCNYCGFTLAWHPVTTLQAKTQRAYCPARRTHVVLTSKQVRNPMYTFMRRYSQPQYLTVPVTTEEVWEPNVNRDGSIRDRSYVSPTFTPEQVAELNLALNQGVAA